MKNETPLEPFSTSSPSVPVDTEKPNECGPPRPPITMLGGAQPTLRQPRPQAQGREKDASKGRSATGNHDPLLTVDEFADQLRVSRACVRKWILERRVAVVKVGRLVRLRSSELRRIVDEGSRPRAHRHFERT
jgi:excisionase family DNA binding protein